jgi:hypothetical protein
MPELAVDGLGGVSVLAARLVVGCESSCALSCDDFDRGVGFTGRAGFDVLDLPSMIGTLGSSVGLWGPDRARFSGRLEANCESARVVYLGGAEDSLEARPMVVAHDTWALVSASLRGRRICW